MKKRPTLVLRDPVKLYEKREIDEITPKIETSKIEDQSEIKSKEIEKEEPAQQRKLESKTNNLDLQINREKIRAEREKMSPRIRQIWDYISTKANLDGEIKTSFTLTRNEVMKEAGIGSTNTYRDALKKFQELNLLKIELRPGVISGSLFTLTEKGIENL